MTTTVSRPVIVRQSYERGQVPAQRVLTRTSVCERARRVDFVVELSELGMVVVIVEDFEDAPVASRFGVEYELAAAAEFLGFDRPDRMGPVRETNLTSL